MLFLTGMVSLIAFLIYEDLCHHVITSLGVELDRIFLQIYLKEDHFIHTQMLKRAFPFKTIYYFLIMIKTFFC